jgi:hypothetical protein
MVEEILHVKGVSVGGFYPTNTCWDLKVFRLFRVGTKGTVHAEVKFVNTGTKRTARVGEIRRGTVKDNYSPRVYGVGYVGAADIPEGRKEYNAWTNMLGRCYDTSNKYYTYYGEKGVRVSVDWHNFSSFLAWWGENYIEGYQLDKDLFSDDEAKVYSPFTCCFLPQKLNVLISNLSTGSGVLVKDKRWVYGGGTYPRRSFRTKQEAFLYRTECFKTRLDKFLKDDGLVLPERVVNAVVVVLQKEVDRLEE